MHWVSIFEMSNLFLDLNEIDVKASLNRKSKYNYIRKQNEFESKNILLKKRSKACMRFGLKYDKESNDFSFHLIFIITLSHLCLFPIFSFILSSPSSSHLHLSFSHILLNSGHHPL